MNQRRWAACAPSAEVAHATGRGTLTTRRIIASIIDVPSASATCEGRTHVRSVAPCTMKAI
eukprot:jgi/Chrpa1/18790/Chrysochromulina_OHIO_Genome00006126-RA